MNLRYKTERHYSSISIFEMEKNTCPQPSSPGVSPVQLSDCIEELLRFTLSLAMEEEALELNIVLSKYYCTALLKEEEQEEEPGRDDTCLELEIPDVSSCEEDATATGGVPPYPLYKRLALALQSCVAARSFRRLSNINLHFREDEPLDLKEKEWSDLILDKGPELENMLKDVEFELHVQEPFFSQLRVGAKTIEGRCAVGEYKRIGPGALLLINQCLLLEVEDVKCYGSFSEMLEAESLAKLLPGVKTIEEGVQIYRRFYAEEKERSNGVLAIYVSKLAAQPYNSMANIISGLGYEGVGSLLGLMHTTGTVIDALPPPRSDLLSSFVMPHKPNVKCNTLTDGARSLAKHVHRNSSGWWGSFNGNDSNKNRLALKVIGHLITHCCWMNIHIVQPYEAVFEIRVSRGYGARWLKNGSKFIGFLEPYMEEGRSKRWKH